MIYCSYITVLPLVRKETGINNSSGSCVVFLKDGYAFVHRTMRNVQLDPGTLPGEEISRAEKS